jgi:NAD(P)-dependent dehydrogenase (short-subunit alcohol dehydrogenase family)
VKRIAIIGASGAIGKAFVERYAARETTECVYAFSRSGTNFTRSNIINANLDLEDPSSIEAASEQIATAGLDLVIAATGILHVSDDASHEKALRPEKSLQQLEPEQLQRVFAINTIGPALLMKYFLPLLKKNTSSVFAVLSARVGSISDNRLGGWYSYRASKAALNMLVKTAAIETARRNKQAIIVALHPGTVDSKLSSPFQARVPEAKLFTPTQAAEYLSGVLDSLDSSQSGLCVAWDGKPIPS